MSWSTMSTPMAVETTTFMSMTVSKPSVVVPLRVGSCTLPNTPTSKRDDRASGERSQRDGHALGCHGVCHWFRILRGRAVWERSAAY